MCSCIYCAAVILETVEVAFISHAGIAAGAGRASCLSVCLSVSGLNGKRLELSTPNSVHIYSIAVAWHALTKRLKGQQSRSHAYEN